MKSLFGILLRECVSRLLQLQNVYQLLQYNTVYDILTQGIILYNCAYNIQLIFDNLTSLPIHTFTWNPCSTNIAIGYLWIPLQSSLIRYNLGCVEIQVQNWFSDIVYFQPTCIIIIQSSTGSL